MIRQISQFTLLINKQTKSFNIWIKANAWEELTNKDMSSTLLIGHKTDDKTGEFICIELYSDEIKIYNDVFGAIPVYMYETEIHFGITNSLSKLSQIINIKTEIEERKLYEYFIFGYHTYSNQTYYKHIKSIQTQFDFSYSIANQSFSTKISEDSIYNDETKSALIDSKHIAETLREEASSGMRQLGGKSALLLSGGKDSLLGGLLTKSICKNNSLNTATFGLKQSLDIVLAKERSTETFKSEHYEFLIDNLNITNEDFINHAIAQNGFGTLSSIYYSYFIKYLVELGFSNAIFSDHFECTRKEIPDIAYLNERYTTPKNVVEKYIKHQNTYYNYLEEAINNIQKHYGNNACYKFYYHDRNQRGQAWKIVLCNEYGLVKYNLSNHIKFLQQNYKDVNFKKQFNYAKIVDRYSEECGFKKTEAKTQDLKLKDIPIDPKELIYDHSAFFIETLNTNNSLELDNYFNLENIIGDIENKTITNNGEWFILRLLNLTIFNIYLNKKK